MIWEARYRKAFKEKKIVLDGENESPVRWFEDQQAMKREREVVQRRKQSKAQCTLQLRRRKCRAEENNKSRGGVEQRREPAIEQFRPSRSTPLPHWIHHIRI